MAEKISAPMTLESIYLSGKAKRVEIRDPGIGNSDLWFKYNEGFSNAVRKTIYVKNVHDMFMSPCTQSTQSSTAADTSLLNESFQ